MKCLRDGKYDHGMQGPCSAGQCRWPECSYTPQAPKLSPKQKDALLWLYPDGWRRWHGCGNGLTDPAAITLQSLVDRDLAAKWGGGGFPARYALLSKGKEAREKLLSSAIERAGGI